GNGDVNRVVARSGSGRRTTAPPSNSPAAPRSEATTGTPCPSAASAAHGGYSQATWGARQTRADAQTPAASERGTQRTVPPRGIGSEPSPPMTVIDRLGRRAPPSAAAPAEAPSPPPRARAPHTPPPPPPPP